MTWQIEPVHSLEHDGYVEFIVRNLYSDMNTAIAANDPFQDAVPCWHPLSDGVREMAMLGSNGDWEEIPLSEALTGLADGTLYECSECNTCGRYDDGLRSFHPAN